MAHESVSAIWPRDSQVESTQLSGECLADGFDLHCEQNHSHI